MRIRLLPVVFVLTLTAGLIASLGPVASADHLSPPGPFSPTTESTQAGAPFGTGTWTHITNFPPNPGSDFALFRGRDREIYASSGTLGGGDEGHVGQRITRLTNNQGNVVNPTWVADHGSANCSGAGNTGNLGLQHDAAAAGAFRTTSRPTSIPGVQTLDTQLIIDATDATGRCHDTPGGGLELIDITDRSQPREIHLTRHNGTSHTVTVDATRPYIVYNSNSNFGSSTSSQNWIDVLDVRTCLNLGNAPIAQKRAACRPLVYRIPFQPSWTYQRNFHNGSGAIDSTSGSAACHDITAVGTRLYCAAIRATLILDVANLTDENGNIRGTPMPCPVVAGTSTTAMVTNCSGQGPTAPTVDPSAFEFLGTRNHAGIDCTAAPAPRNQGCNSNLVVPVTQDIAISHEADPTHDERVMFATDERGGGVVPPGASCSPGGPTNVSNGGIHALDISGAAPGRDPADNFPYMLKPDGSRAVFIGEVKIPDATFCTVHMIEHAHNEQRLFVAYYSQGVKVVDYFFHTQGTADPSDDRMSFRETSSFILPNAVTWVAHPFKTVNNADGTKTYFLMAGDIQRGIDVYSYRAAPNPIGAPPPAEATATVQAAGLDSVGMLLLGVAALPATAWYRRRRRFRA
jgi:hypothetical protein